LAQLLDFCFRIQHFKQSLMETGGHGSADGPNGTRAVFAAAAAETAFNLNPGDAGNVTISRICTDCAIVLHLVFGRTGQK
jgi:uncharacterized caspase-like protein